MRRTLMLAGALALLPRPAHAFVEVERGDLTLELRGNVRVNDTVGYLPKIAGLPSYDRDLNAVGSIFRLMLDAGWSETVALEAHVFQTFSASPQATLTGVADGFGAQEAGRTAALSWRWWNRGGTAAELAVDRLVLKAYLPKVRLAVGRQPVTFATTYFFTPNDFFQAFSAQAFFRLYKPGVDAARVDVELGELSELTVVGVLGYKDEDPNRRVEGPSWDASSVLARASTTLFDFEWSVMGGKAPFAWVVGGGAQGEVLDWLGVRVEGHVAIPQDDADRTRAELAVGLEHRFEISLHLRLEYFYNGSGRTDPAAYAAVYQDPVALNGTPYLGKHYVVLGASRELTALLTGDAFLLVNLTDRSFQAAVALAYSLLDEVDLAVVASVPVGKGLNARLLPVDPWVVVTPGSELGSYPIAVSAEVRAYF
ncbi:MAG: hypothetical protein KC933_22735 [Myxococcales bacterium]|nr:hypothetical protein [Myxococcales bacterium]